MLEKGLKEDKMTKGKRGPQQKLRESRSREEVVVVGRGTLKVVT